MGAIAIADLSVAHDVSAVETCLDDAQLARLAKISNPQRKRQFLAARSLAIQLLTQQGLAGALMAQESGRPQAKHWPHPNGLSWTHNRDWAGAALGVGRVGIDIETIRPRRNILAIAESYFSPKELRYLQSLPHAEQTHAFFILWVVKEALLKALGTGIVGGLSRFELFQQQGQWQFNSQDGSWHLKVWQLSENALCALASDTAQPWEMQFAPAKSLLGISD